MRRGSRGPADDRGESRRPSRRDGFGGGAAARRRRRQRVVAGGGADPRPHRAGGSGDRALGPDSGRRHRFRRVGRHPAHAGAGDTARRAGRRRPGGDLPRHLRAADRAPPRAGRVDPGADAHRVDLHLERRRLIGGSLAGRGRPGGRRRALPPAALDRARRLLPQLRAGAARGAARRGVRGARRSGRSLGSGQARDADRGALPRRDPRPQRRHRRHRAG